MWHYPLRQADHDGVVAAGKKEVVGGGIAVEEQELVVGVGVDAFVQLQKLVVLDFHIPTVSSMRGSELT